MPEETLEAWLERPGTSDSGPVPSAPLGSGGWALGVQGFDRSGDPGSEPGAREAREESGSAYFLLAADAFFTYACEAVAREGNVRAGLEGLLGLLGDRFS